MQQYVCLVVERSRSLEFLVPFDGMPFLLLACGKLSDAFGHGFRGRGSCWRSRLGHSLFFGEVSHRRTCMLMRIRLYSCSSPALGSVYAPLGDSVTN